MVRYRTHDITHPSDEPCACGRINAIPEAPASRWHPLSPRSNPPVLFGSECVTTDDLQSGEISLGELPHDGCGDIFVVVPQYIADTRNLSPRNVRMTSFQFVRQVVACLGNDLDTALNKPLRLPLCLENIERHIAEHGTNALNGFNNIRKPQDGRPYRH
jgi:hypothetical protein